MSKGSREIRKPKTVKPKAVAAAPALAPQSPATRKK
jgi:hypothetical protein